MAGSWWLNRRPRAWAVAIGQPAHITSTVAEITGVSARAFHDWAADHAAEFAVPQRSDSLRSDSYRELASQASKLDGLSDFAQRCLTHALTRIANWNESIENTAYSNAGALGLKLPFWQS